MRAISPNLDWSYDRDDHYLADLAAFGPFYRSAGWTDAHIPRTEKPVRFRRVAIRKRDAWGMGWDHYRKSETFRYGY